MWSLKTIKETGIVFPLLILFASAILSSGCPILSNVDITASGPVTTRDYQITDFKNIQAGSIFELELLPSDTFGIAITTNQNIFEYVEVTKSGSTLNLHLTHNISFRGPVTLKARIGMPELQSVILSGAAKATAYGFQPTPVFNLNLSGASRFDMDLDADEFRCNISGAGKAKGRLRSVDTRIHLSGAAELSLDGSGGNASIITSGAGAANLADFEMENVDINASGGSHASIYVHQTLNVTLSGGASLVYGGNPSIGKVNVSGGARLQQK